jgi:hypothetical protein
VTQRYEVRLARLVASVTSAHRRGSPPLSKG